MPSAWPKARLSSFRARRWRLSLGEANVELAIRDALATFAADEIVVAVRPEDEEGLVESKATADVSKRSVDGVPVRLVVIAGA